LMGGQLVLSRPAEGGLSVQVRVPQWQRTEEAMLEAVP